MLRKFSILYFLVLCLFIALQAEDDVKIISSNSNSVLVEYTPQFTDTSYVTIDGNKFFTVNIYKGVFESDPYKSQPALPKRIINIGVPSEFGNTIQLLDAQYKIINGTVIPSPVFEKENGEIQESYKITDDYRNLIVPEIVTFGEYGLLREMPLQKIIINPVIYDPNSKNIKLYSKIRFRINFSRPLEKRKSVDEQLNSSVINFDAAKSWGKVLSKSPSVIENSVLANGTWYKFEAPEEGIYRIDRNTLSSLGIDAENVDPRTIKIYNNGGYQLNDSVTASRPVDLVQNSIMVVGEEDGVFNEGDYILFYGRGTNFFEYDPHQNKIHRFKNEFSTHNYYFITSGGSEGKRIQTRESLDEIGAEVQTESDAFLYHEENLINIGKSGRDYWGESLSSTNNSINFVNTLAGLVNNSEINYKFRIANTTSVGTSNPLTLTIDENNVSIYSGIIPGWTASYIYGRDLEGDASFTGTLPDDRSVLGFSISGGTSNAQAHLDYFEIKYRRSLSAVNDEFIFFADLQNGTIQYNLSNFSVSDIHVFNVTDHSNIEKIDPLILSGGDFRFQIQENQSQRRKYIALTSDKYKTITNIQPVTNSNIRGISPGNKYIIVTHPDFKSQAERLADFRKNQANYPISTVVVTTNEIYNEFSCGSLSPIAIRDFISYAFKNWQTKPELVLLFGDGDYDYLNVEGINGNFVPTYQTKESLLELKSYPLDDFYSRVSGEDSIADVGVGRLNITSSPESEIAVDKIISYETSTDRSLWRNLITLVADDGPTSKGNDGSIHTSQSEDLSNIYIPDSFDQNKIYLAAYPTVVTGSGRRKPAVNQAIVDAVNNGTLLLNFIGHGNPDVWTHENVFLKDITIPQLQNDNLFFLTAATCNFGQYDTPGDPSATEIMLLKENGGVIGAFTASRPVYSNLNAALNNIFFSNLFGTKDAQGLPRRIGTSYMLTKIDGSPDKTNDEKYTLFADPALRLNQPNFPARIDSINSKNLSTEVNINALGNVTVSGTVQNPDGSQSNFNGEAIISVFDAKRNIKLEEMNYTITEQGGLLFRGRVSVNNGYFDASFTVPKDISYQNENGKVVAYAFNNNNDAVGYTNKIIVGGTDTTATNDGSGPGIEIYFDDLSFESSYLVNSNFTLLAKLEDETGINTTGSGVGHNLEAVINDDEDNPIDLTSNFVGDLDAGGKSGVIRYKFSNFEPGDYKIRVEAWDVFNNLSTEQTFFSVVNDDDLTIREVYNYPNPFSSNTTFTFQQNLSKPLNVRIKVYTIAGRLIKEIEQFNILEKFVRVPWDGRDEDGSIIANGTYLYKLIVESTDGEYKQTVLGKLAVIR